MNIKEGSPTIAEYKEITKSNIFFDLKNSSQKFLNENKQLYKKYIWSKDPLIHWSRQWEYPYVFFNINSFFQQDRNLEASRILDVGSGFTFFPFFLSNKINQAEVFCCDEDASLSFLYDAANKKNSKKINFSIGDAKKLPYPEKFFDILYCISVLEHTKNYQEIVKELNRVLKPGGIAIITFDISLKGDTDISVEKARELVRIFETEFPGNKRSHLIEIKNDILKTSFFLETKEKRKLLPWHFSWKTPVAFLKKILKLRFPQSGFRELSLFCATFKKYENLHY